MRSKRVESSNYRSKVDALHCIKSPENLRVVFEIPTKLQQQQQCLMNVYHSIVITEFTAQLTDESKVNQSIYM